MEPENTESQTETTNAQTAVALAPATTTAPAATAENGPIVGKSGDEDWTDEEKARLAEMFAKGQDVTLLSGEDGVTKTLTPADFKATTTLFFKGCNNGVYDIAAPVTKLLIERCDNCTFTIRGHIKTEVVELWRNNNIHVKCAVPVKTMQADLIRKMKLEFKKKELLGSLVWAGVYDLSLSFRDSPDVLESGFEQMKEQYPDINDQFDQFIVRFVEGKLLSEQIVRLKNGYPTTEREAAEFDAQQARDEAAREEYIRKLVKFAAPKIGIKDDSKRPKVGRNEKCPCGSAKKFKSCCWSKYEH